MPDEDGKSCKVLYWDLGDGNLMQFNGIVETIDDNRDSEEDICPSVHWTEEPSISFNIDMRRRDHRRLLKIFHSMYMHEYRMRRNRKRAKEQARRAMLKWNALHPQNKHSL